MGYNSFGDKMKNLLVSMNSKYIHGSLGVWYLKAAAKAHNIEVELLNCTINDSMDRVLARIYKEKPDVLAFSCYIWNIEQILWLCSNIKKILPNTFIILGGPEVSFDTSEIIVKNPSVNCIIKGEGEEVFTRVLKALVNNESLEDIPSLCIRKGEAISESQVFSIIHDLNSLPSPYTEEMLRENSGRIIYFEASRGCPFNCAYCLSSTFEGVRHFNLKRIQEELKKIVQSGTKQIKFVDRTFNANKKRAAEIIEFVIDTFGHLRDVNFHFEVAADLFDDTMFDIVKEIPEGLIQFEVGVQSTNPEVLNSVQRKTDVKKVLENINKLKAYGNVHVHADLIAGLPGENLQSFEESFNDLFKCEPHQLQLGFLKLLHGCGIRKEYKKYSYVYKSTPPYEVLCSSVLSFEDIQELKIVEEMVDRLNNSNFYSRSLKYLIHEYGKTAYSLFRDFGQWYEGRGLFERGISSKELYSLLLEFGKNLSGVDSQLLTQLLIFDFLSSNNTGNIPGSLRYETDGEFRDKCFEFLRNETNIALYLPNMLGKSSKEIYKSVKFFRFDYDISDEDCYIYNETVVLFDYTSKDRVSGLYKNYPVKLNQEG